MEIDLSVMDGSTNVSKADSEIIFKRELVNLENVCSCCLADGVLNSMLSQMSVDGKAERYIDALNECYNMQLLDSTNDAFLRHICDVCVQKLAESQAFKNQVINAQRALLLHFSDQAISLNSRNKTARSQHSNNILDTNHTDTKMVSESADDSDNCFDDDKDYTLLKSEPAVTKLGMGRPLRKTKKVKMSNKIENMPKSSEKKVGSGKTTARPCMYASMDLKNMQCRVCSAKFKSNHFLRQHMNEHFINYTCEKCGKGFATANRYSQHMRRHITGTFKCGTCDNVFDNAAKLDCHRASHRLWKYICQFCNERFKSFYTRQKHTLNEHSQGGGYPCTHCAAVCLTSSMLNAHVRSKHTERVRSHGCQECSKEFYDRRSLMNHMVSHSRQRDYACPECKKMYARKKTLVQHMKIHNNVRDHVCSHCGLSFVQKCSLKWHLRKHVKETDLEKL